MQETRSDLESTLIRIEGLVSLVIDVEHQRVTMRTLSYVTAQQIAQAIAKNNENMEARLVTRNKYNQEFLVKLVRNFFSYLQFHLFCFEKLKVAVQVQFF